jgi:hypothetical protein
MASPHSLSAETVKYLKMSKAYKYRGGTGILDKDGKSIFERDVNTIVDNRIYLPTRNELNDPTEGLFNDDAVSIFLEQFKEYSSEVRKRYDGLIQKFGDIGVYSLSKNHSDELLWAYYASGHTGFAIEYDTDILKESLNYNQYFQFVFDFDVDYVESVPNVDIFALHGRDTKDILKTCLGSKSVSWLREREYRLIFEGQGLFDIDHRAVTGIYFGYRMQEQEIEFVMDKLKGRGLCYYKMDLIGRTYKFEPVRIEDKFPDAPRYYANSIDYDVDELLLCGGMSKEEAVLYREKFIDALESLKNDPLIERFYLATMSINSTEPLLVIWAYTKAKVPPAREFNFKLNDKGEVYRVK